MTKRIDELVATICGAPDHPLAPLLRCWCAESRPFAAFAEAYATKIRKKARLAQHGDALADLCAELAVAASMLRDRRFVVHYEPQHAIGQRGPDFQVIFKANAVFHVEVTRLRPPDLAATDTAGAARKLARVLCDKIGQCLAGNANMLVVIAPPDAASEELATAALRLLDSYLQRDSARLLPELPLEDVRAFLRQRQRLSAIALCTFTLAWHPQQVMLWRNQQAKHPLHPEVANYLLQLPA